MYAYKLSSLFPRNISFNARIQTVRFLVWKLLHIQKKPVREHYPTHSQHNGIRED